MNNTAEKYIQIIIYIFFNYILFFSSGPIYFGPIYFGPIYFGPIYLGPIYFGPIYLGPIYLGPLFLCTVRSLFLPAPSWSSRPLLLRR